MSALPLVVKAVLAAGVLASMARAFLGPPAPPAHRHLGRSLLVLTGLCYATGAVLVTVGGAELVGSVVVLAGGYPRSLDTLVEIHCATFEEARLLSAFA